MVVGWAGPFDVREREPGLAVEQLVRGAGAAAARGAVRGGRVDAAVGGAQPAAARAPRARRRARQAAGQPALLPGTVLLQPILISTSLIARSK